MNGTNLTGKALTTRARELQIPGRSKMTADQLRAAIQAATTPAPVEQPKAPVARPFPADGSPLTCDAGNHTVRLIPALDGFTVQVVTGTHRHTDLDQSIRDERLARATARRYTQALRDGVKPAELAAQLHGIGAQVDAAARDIIWDKAQPAAPDGDVIWEHHRTLDAFRGNHRPVRPTKTLVFRQPPTGPQLRAVRSHHEGRVYYGPGTGNLRATLVAAADKDYGQLVRDPQRPARILYLELNATGLAAANAQVAA